MAKGGSTTSKVEVPKYIEDAAKANLAKADALSKIGHTRYYGPDVAAFSPMQEAAFQNTANAASAFGLGGGTGMEGMPAPTTYAGGVRGYSSAPMFEQAMAELQSRRPGQYDAINAPFIDPVTGAAPAFPYGTNLAQANDPSVTNPYNPYSTTPDFGQYGGGSNQTHATSNGFSNPMFGLPGGFGGIENGNTSTSNGFTDMTFGLPSGFGGIESGNTFGRGN
jgi:hypothetical protein